MRNAQPVQDAHSFLVLPENQMAHAACLRLVDPLVVEPPLVTLFGPPGSGKSHLARRTVRDAQARSPRMAVLVLTANDFAAQLHTAASTGKMRPLQERIRSQTELFVFEDLHRLEGRTESQQQFVAILDDLLAQGRRILLTSRKSPGEIPRLSRKIVNRCHGGLPIEIGESSAASRRRLVRLFAETAGVELSDPLVALAASEAGRSPRDLQRLVESMRSAALRRRATIDEPLIRDLLARTGEARLTISEIAKVVARAYDAKVADLRSAARTQGLVVPRQVAMFLARELMKAEYQAIGDYFGGRNHATVIYACDRIRELSRSQAELGVQVARLREDLAHE
jgi:chromosomal replication initiator protein